MNAQGRGQAGGVDPADQWVFDPNTGSYELQLSPVSEDTPNSPASGSTSSPAAGRRRASAAAGPRTQSRSAPARDLGDGEGNGAGDGSRGPGGIDEDAAASPQDSREPRLPAQRRRSRAANASASSAAGGRRASGRNRRRRKQGLTRKQKVLRWSVGSVVMLLVVVAGAGTWLYLHLAANINSVDTGRNNAAVTKGPVNLLVLGTDARNKKADKGYGDSGSVGHADTTILFHVSADRSNATALSIPRDLKTDVPNCTTRQPGKPPKHIPGQQDTRFNTSLGQQERDQSCTMRTVEKLTGLHIQHFLQADFGGVKSLSTAVGGVPICAGKKINDPKSHLKLNKGKHVVKGEQALAFVRTRHAIGLGSDLDRIKLQQQFISALIRKMKSGDTLTSPSKLYDLTDAMTKALTVDEGIKDPGDLSDLVSDLKRVNTKNITFTTLPVLDSPSNDGTVEMIDQKAKPLFKMMRADKSLTKTKKKQKEKAKNPVKGAKKVPASRVRVDVRNGGGPAGAAQESVDWMQNTKGIRLSTNAGNASSQLSKTKLEFSSGQAGQAATLADAMGLPKSSLKEKSGVGKAMKLTLGKDFEKAGEPVSPPEKAPSGVQHNNASKKKCAK